MGNTKFAEVSLPTWEDMIKLMLSPSSFLMRAADGKELEGVLVINPDRKTLGYADFRTKQIYSFIPLSISSAPLVMTVTVTEEIMADPELNPAQEEKATSLLAIRDGSDLRSDDFGGGTGISSKLVFNRLKGTDRFITPRAVCTVTPDSMSYGDSNIRSLVEKVGMQLGHSAVLSVHAGEVYNICRPDRVYCMEPGREVVFGDIERTPGNDSYPDIINDELKPPEHGAVFRDIEPVPEHEWYEKFAEAKEAYMSLMEGREAARNGLDPADAEDREEDELGIG